MMATVPHVSSGSGLRKFQADGFLFDRVCHEFYVKKIPHSAHRVFIRFVCISDKKQCNFPYTALTDWFL